MVDGLCSLKKIPFSIAHKAKFQYSETQKLGYEKHCNQFSGFDYQSDCLDSFMGRALACLLVNFHSLLWPRFCRETVSVNKDLVDTNIKEKSLTSQSLIYDKIVSDYVSISFLLIIPKLRKSYMLTSQRYKQNSDKNRNEKVRSEQSLKRKAKYEKLGN